MTIEIKVRVKRGIMEMQRSVNCNQSYILKSILLIPTPVDMCSVFSNN